MLSRLLTGGEESNCLLILTSSTDAPVTSGLVKLFVQSHGSLDNYVLVKTGIKNYQKNCGVDISGFSKVINFSDNLGWVSGHPLVFPDFILDTVKTSEQSLVVDNLTDLVIFYNLSAITKFVRNFRQSSGKKTKLIALLHKNCLPVSDVTDLKKFFTTVIDIGNTKVESASEKLCVVNHHKVGGKLVTSKEILQLDSDLNIKILPYKEVGIKTQEEEEEVTFDKLTTFNINTSKEAEKEAKEKLVLPFYKEPQKIGEVKLHNTVSGTQEVIDGKIYYEPESGDVCDDEDPDDDLDL